MYPFKKKYRVTQEYGKTPYSVKRPNIYPGGIHRGIDYASPCGTELLAITPGKVVRIGKSGHYGNSIRTQHVINNKRVEVLYAHLESVNVRQGDFILAGQIIGRTGTTGTSTACHLHLGVREDKQWVNPQAYVDMNFQTKEDILKENNMTLEELKKELRKEFVQKDQRLNVYLKDGSTYICNHGKCYKSRGDKKEIGFILHKLSKEIISDAELEYPLTDNINDVL